jgi:hypothetical protein
VDVEGPGSRTAADDGAPAGLAPNVEIGFAVPGFELGGAGLASFGRNRSSSAPTELWPAPTRR